MPVVTTPAILLRSYPYSESSLVLRYLTAELGLVSAIAKGARRQGKGGGGFDNFSEGALTLYVKDSRELQTVKDFEVRTSHLPLGRHPLRFGGAALLAELVLRHAGQETDLALYRHVSDTLPLLEAIDDDAALLARLLAGAWSLVTLLGFGPELGRCVGCGREMEAEMEGGGEVGRFDFEAGGVRCGACGGGGDGPRVGPGARHQLAALAAGRIPDDFSHGQVHLRILGDFVTFHVSGGHRLRSIEYLSRRLESPGGGGSGIGEDA